MLALVQSMKLQPDLSESSDTRDEGARRFVGLSVQEEQDLENLLNSHGAGSRGADIGALVLEVSVVWHRPYSLTDFT
jgi:hypothetical protein